MDERRTEAAAASDFLIPGSESGFPEGAPGSPPPESAEWTRAFDITRRERKRRKTRVSGIRPARSSCLSEEISGGEAEGGRRGITGLTGGTGRAAEWEMEAGEDKSAPFPLLERSKVTYRGHEMMEPNSQEETQRHSGTARMNTDPVVKSLSHLRAQPGPPLLLFRLSPEPVCPCTCSSHPTPPPLKSPGRQTQLKTTASGPTQAPGAWRMGRERRAWEASSFKFDITQTLNLKQSEN